VIISNFGIFEVPRWFFITLSTNTAMVSMEGFLVSAHCTAELGCYLTAITLYIFPISTIKNLNSEGYYSIPFLYIYFFLKVGFLIGKRVEAGAESHQIFIWSRIRKIFCKISSPWFSYSNKDNKVFNWTMGLIRHKYWQVNLCH
jgi:hypothetical protein